MGTYNIQVEKTSMDVANVNTGETFQQEVRVVTVKEIDKTIRIYANEEISRMPYWKIRIKCRDSKIDVFYGARTLDDFNDLFDAAKHDFPEISKEDMEIHTVDETESTRNVGFTVLRVPISVKDFIRLLKEKKIYLL